MRMHLLALLLSSPVMYAQAQTGSFPHKEVILAETSFIDVGPPFDFYNLYLLKAVADGTDVERIAVTPSAGSCALPTTEVKMAHLRQTLLELFHGKDPCSISEKAARKEAKRCKHCLVFSGVHLALQLSCGSATRNIRYEVLDRDLFAENPDTPGATSSSLDLLTSLNQALGGGAFDRPVFTLPDDTPAAQRGSEDKLAKRVQSGEFDQLFGEKISQLSLESLGQPRLPSIELVSSTPATPSLFPLPRYPAIARAAHVEGTITLSLLVDANGRVEKIERETGPIMLRRATEDAVKGWSFAPDKAGEKEISVAFRLNCPQPK